MEHITEDRMREIVERVKADLGLLDHIKTGVIGPERRSEIGDALWEAHVAIERAVEAS